LMWKKGLDELCSLGLEFNLRLNRFGGTLQWSGGNRWSLDME
jgi:hypothetical protein